ncbi:hypothetical protein [Deinococcus sp.]|uniref:hypothetical protein n=1 Tax=Deinococcus sp. TaxID=47478 RepID=UPI003CC595AA
MNRSFRRASWNLGYLRSLLGPYPDLCVLAVGLSVPITSGTFWRRARWASVSAAP